MPSKNMEAFLPAVSNILLGVIGNVLTEILFDVTGVTHEQQKLKGSLKPSLDNALTPIFQKAIAKIARNSQYGDKAQTRRLKDFLGAPEVEAIVRQIYASKLISGLNSSIDIIRDEFVTLLTLNLNASPRIPNLEQTSGNKSEWQSTPFEISSKEPESCLQGVAHQIFDSILEGCESSLQIAINSGNLLAHEAKSTIRYQMLHDEISAIQKNLSFLTSSCLINVQEILDFEEKYRHQIPSRHGYITPPNFDTTRKLPINKLYVHPMFVSIPNCENEKIKVLDIKNFCTSIYRVVLLGNPGGGKSTFSDNLCNDLASHYEDRVLAGRKLTPIHVVLRDYGAAKKKNNCSILEFIQMTAVSKYQLPPIPQGAFEYLLFNGRVVVVFDGLDELVDTSYRQTISGDVESFCSLYPSVPVLVTSREVGYKEAPLDEEKFLAFRLGAFDDEQVEHYVNKWFLASEPELQEQQHTKKVEIFIDESKVVPDLRSNPLMLALLCNIYRGEGYIPRNRPDVYEKCAVMLFERWDRSRGIQISLPFESRIIFAMMHLAYWIYTNETLQEGVTEQELIRKSTEYLCQRQFEDTDEAERAAGEFIEFCRGRAWVFTDTGTMKEGERLYQFTHRTFLEYFTASHLVRVSRSPGDLQGVLLPKITKREWDVVAQLAFRIQDKQTEGSGDELLTALIKESHDTFDSERWNLLSFAARCLKFMVPAPGVRRNIVTECVDFCVGLGTSYLNDKKGKILRNKFDINQPIATLIYELVTCAPENQITIGDELQKQFSSYISHSDESTSFVSYEMGCHLNMFYSHFSKRVEKVNRERTKFWRDTSNVVFESCSSQIKSMCPKYYRAAIDCFYKGEITLAEVIEWHGISSIFNGPGYVSISGLTTQPLIVHLLSELLIPKQANSYRRAISGLDMLGQIFSSLPLIRMEDLEDFRMGRNLFARFKHMFGEKTGKTFQIESFQIPPNAIFAIFAICAVSVEYEQVKIEKFKNMQREWEMLFPDKIRDSKLPFLSFFQKALLSRLSLASMDEVKAELKASPFTPKQQSLIHQWADGKISFHRC